MVVAEGDVEIVSMPQLLIRANQAIKEALALREERARLRHWAETLSETPALKVGLEAAQIECSAHQFQRQINRPARLHDQRAITLIDHGDGDAVRTHGGRPGNANWSTNDLSDTDTYGLSQGR
jgi:hypothetical protein